MAPNALMRCCHLQNTTPQRINALLTVKELKRDCFLFQCCGQLSCDGCIRQWFETSKTCPLCRAEDVNESKPELPCSLLELLDIFSKAEQKDMAGASNAD